MFEREQIIKALECCLVQEANCPECLILVHTLNAKDM